MKRKFVKLGALFGASAVGLALLGTAETLQGFLAPVLGSSSMPFFSFRASTNRLYSGSSSSSGSAVALSGAQTPISFDYSLLSVVNASAWQSIAQNGYFTNSAPIHGLTSFLCELSSGSSVRVYWSKTTTFSESDSATYSADFTCSFASSYPSYLKVVALADSTIPSASIGFDCQLHSLESSFTLGKYPQTVVEDSATLAALESASDTDSDGYLEYGEEEYKKLTTANAYSNKSISGKVTFQNRQTYYFKVEPIEWRVLSGTGTNTGLLLSERILDNVLFYTNTDDRNLSGSTIHANNYEYSTLRAMLNGLDGSAYTAGNYSGKGFLDVAFTATEKTLITGTVVDNVTDQIFTLSRADVLNASYGFDGSEVMSSTRYGVLTDYARALGCYLDNSNGYWWSRTPSTDDGGSVYDVGCDGYPGTAPVSYANNGVRPALTLTLS